VAKKTVLRESLTEQINTILIDRIVEGTLQPGDRLKELQIAKEFGTSQAPVREAIRSLQALGYVEHKAHVGALVKRFSKKEIEEAYQVREALENHCLRLLSVEQKKLEKELRRQLDNMENAWKENNVKLFTQADNMFHRAIIESSENARMLELWDSLKIQSQVIATITEAEVPLEELYYLHKPIVTALEGDDQEGSADLLIKHYRQTGCYWEKHGKNLQA
jgi:DNA-binding GntR family transcriptional regulator